MLSLRKPSIIDLTRSPIGLTDEDHYAYLAQFPSSCWERFIPSIGPMPAKISNWKKECGSFPGYNYHNNDSIPMPPNGQSRRMPVDIDQLERETIPRIQSVTRKTNPFKKPPMRKFADAPIRRLANQIIRRAPIAIKLKPMKKKEQKRMRLMENKRKSKTMNGKTRSQIKDLRVKLKNKEKEIKKKYNKKETKAEKKKRLEKKEKKKIKSKKIKSKISELEKKIKKRNENIEKMNKKIEKLIKDEKKKPVKNNKR
jgi:hypothetical protein